MGWVLLAGDDSEVAVSDVGREGRALLEHFDPGPRVCRPAFRVSGVLFRV